MAEDDALRQMSGPDSGVMPSCDILLSMSSNDAPESCIFLFRSDIVKLGDYGTPARRAVITALFHADPDMVVSSRMLEGDLLVARFAERIVSYRHDPDAKTTSATYAMDRDLAMLLVAEISESLSELENTLNHDQLITALLAHSVFGFMFPSLPRTVWKSIDMLLAQTVGYIGASALDTGNPIHVTVFSESLVDQIYIDRGTLALRAEKGAYEPLVSEWHDVGAQRVVLDYGDGGPPRLVPGDLSARGKQARERLQKKSAPSAREKVARALQGVTRSKLPVLLGRPTVSQSIVGVEKKLLAYSLNREHPEGQHKATVFESALGITSVDAGFLGRQLEKGLPLGDVERVRANTHNDILYHVDVPVIGRNGVTRAVRTAWAVWGEQPIRLVTAYVLDDNTQIVHHPEPLSLVSPSLNGDDKWAALQALASQRAQQAAADAAPTPMFIVSGWKVDGLRSVELEGYCGGAYVVVTDGVKGFAGWLRRNEIGRTVNPRHQEVSAMVSSQSHARALAYATTYHEVLTMNGVKATIESYYD